MEKHRELEAASALTVKMILAYGIEKLGSDTDPLPFRHYYKPCSPVRICYKQRRDGEMTHRLAVDDTDKVFCGHREREV